jgi:hypothetical protein
MFDSCKGKTAKTAEADIEEQESIFNVIDKYVAEEFGSQYSQGDHCIPSPLILEVDESDPGDIKVWGDSRVYNYVQSGDTLKTVSGGSHPGLLHLKEVDGKFEVTDFNAVADGADNIPSAERIFKDKFDAFQKAYSDQDQREEARKRAIASYVFRHGLPVKVYKDYGWPAVEIPEPEK